MRRIEEGHLKIKKRNLSHIAAHILLLMISAVYIIPFVWMVTTALKTAQELYACPDAIFPKNPVLNNFFDVFVTIPYIRYLANTAFVSISCVIGFTLTASMVAYSMSKIEWFGRKWLFPIIIGTMMIPTQVTMIPLYMTYQKIGAVGTYLPLILPAFCGGPYYIFLLRQFFRTVPDCLTEAARIDGASEIRIFSAVVLPLCVPALISIAVFAFMAAWGDFFNPMLYLNDQEKYTVSLGLQAFMSENKVEWGQLMAASTLFTLPTIVLFFFAQKSFVEGIAVTGIKG